MDNSTTRLLEEITGQKVEYAQMLGSSEESDVQSALLDGGYSLIKMQRGSYDQNVIQGAFYDITDLIEEYGQNLLATIDESAWDACYYEGKLYAVPEVGFGHMYNNAIVFNMEHLAEVGITDVPSTLTEFTDALHALQDHFGSDPNYHAFSMPGAEAYQPLITGCFEVPYEFYVNEDDEITSWIYSQEADNYLHYMNDLNNYGNGCLSTSWAQATSANVMGFYVQGLCSVAVLPYWNISGTCESMAATGAADSAQDALDNMGFALYLLGDGSYGSVDQTADNSWQLADNTDIGYFCAIPIDIRIRKRKRSPPSSGWTPRSPTKTIVPSSSARKGRATNSSRKRSISPTRRTRTAIRSSSPSKRRTARRSITNCSPNTIM